MPGAQVVRCDPLPTSATSPTRHNYAWPPAALATSSASCAPGGSTSWAVSIVRRPRGARVSAAPAACVDVARLSTAITRASRRICGCRRGPQAPCAPKAPRIEFRAAWDPTTVDHCRSRNARSKPAIRLARELVARPARAEGVRHPIVEPGPHDEPPAARRERRADPRGRTRD